MSPRVMPENRIPDIINAAATVFGNKGYRLAQMEEVAEEAHVSKATLYYYFKSKLHLFYYLLENGIPGDGVSVPPPGDTPPISEEDLLKVLKGRLKRRARLESISRSLDIGDPQEIDLSEEIAMILQELWNLFEKSRVQIIILEKSALEFPELAQVYDRYARQQVLLQLEQYLESRVHLGVIRPPKSVEVAARAILEATAWFGFKQMRDYMLPVRYPESEALPELIDIFLNGLKHQP